MQQGGDLKAAGHGYHRAGEGACLQQMDQDWWVGHQPILHRFAEVGGRVDPAVARGLDGRGCWRAWGGVRHPIHRLVGRLQQAAQQIPAQPIGGIQGRAADLFAHQQHSTGGAGLGLQQGLPECGCLLLPQLLPRQLLGLLHQLQALARMAQQLVDLFHPVLRLAREAGVHAVLEQVGAAADGAEHRG